MTAAPPKSPHPPRPLAAPPQPEPPPAQPAPQPFQALHLLALLRHRQGQASQAIAALRKAIALAPHHAFLHSNLSHLLGEAGEFDAASAAADTAIQLAPDLPEAHLHRGNALAAIGDTAAAIAAFARATELRPADARAHGNLANALQSAGQLDAAIASHRRALQLDPGSALLQSNFATALDAAGDSESAIAMHRRALAATAPSQPASAALLHSNFGCALHRAGQISEAETAQRRALALCSTLPQAQVNLALLSLLAGRYREGWDRYEWRWQDAQKFPDARRKWNRPRWDGSALAGRTVLLHAEQGAGDSLQFARYVPQVARLGGTVILECQPGLHRLLSGSPLGQSATIARRGMHPPDASFDLHLPLASLPRVLGQIDPQDSVRQPYLAADPQRRRPWRRRIDGLANRKIRPTIGLAWAGSPTHTDDRRRSLPLAMLAPLAGVDATFVSLQRGPAAAQAHTPPPGMRLIDWASELHDWSDTAALVAELDAVISVDTAVAHLAGALGKPVAILLPAVPDARWLLARDDSPWYPTARLFRQPAGDWASAIAQLRSALAAAISAHGSNVTRVTYTSCASV